jgi:hypothetical protein
LLVPRARCIYDYLSCCLRLQTALEPCDWYAKAAKIWNPKDAQHWRLYNDVRQFREVHGAPADQVFRRRSSSGGGGASGSWWYKV